MDYLIETERPPFPRAPFFRIWIAPRATIRAIIDSGHTGSAWVIAAFLGIGRFSPGAHPTATTILGATLYTLAVGIPAWLIASVILSWVGQKLGGNGDLEDLKIAVAWGSVPLIIAAALGILMETVTGTVASCLLALPLLTSLGWGIVVYVKAVAEAHSVSAWRALGMVAICMTPLLLLGGVSLLMR